uniref:Rho GTPase activating protein 27 n=1 Tax=Seriola lalandi dorsalis TaxID=1841481 RepID=A0A3B4X922_SERLL
NYTYKYKLINPCLVSVQYEFEYTAKDGHLVSIKPNESYILVSKTNDHWWHVRKDQHTRPFYIPAQYVKELPSHTGDSPGANELESTGRVTNSKPVGTVGVTPDAHRLSTFGSCGNLPDVKLCETQKGEQSTSSFAPTHTDHTETHNPAGSFSFTSAPVETDNLQVYAKPQLVVKVGKGQQKPKISLQDDKVEQPQFFVDDEDMTFPTPPSSPIYDTIPDKLSFLLFKSTFFFFFFLAFLQVENESPRSAVYVNVAQLRQSISESPPSAPLSYSPSYLDPEGWEVHTDQESGQEYYYHPATGRTTWDNPFLDSPTDPEPFSAEEPRSPSPPQSPALSLSTASPPAWTSDWEQLVDETSGRPYFYNAMSGETSWEPPEQLSPYPPLMEPMKYTLSHVSRTIIPRANLDRSTPAGWNLTVEPNGTWVFTSEHSPDQWIKSMDDRGQTYYYLRDGSKSQWNLPEVTILFLWLCNYNSCLSELGFSLPFCFMDLLFSDINLKCCCCFLHFLHFQVQNLEKAGILNKTKVSENGKKVRKNWAQTWTVLHGGVLTFHKDPKSAATGNKTNQIVPEVAVDLRGATIGWASKDKSSKKNVLELKGKNGVEFLIQYDTESIINDWHKVLMDTIRQLDHHSEEEDGDLYEKIPNTERDDRPTITPSSSSAGDADQKRVRTKLMKFLMKRPTLQSVKEKGYIRENVFGCHLGSLCAQEKTTVPSFVERCISAVEKRGLDIDGLYRVSGNLAVIQKLRFKADHEELDLEDGQWEDVHVITGALKLFFRELAEPLFPFSYFNGFISAIRIPDYNTKLHHMCELVRTLPTPHHETMKLLFGHLRRVIQFGEDNRMTVQNVAIVFGPTLLRPEMESANIAMHMVFQNQIVEFILNEYERIFRSS